ncbi:hypothetical protein I6N96_09340 [Enterococcus sp. BWM-S5]|uniref:Leucine-rich repeat domain-containing protein n=1 Tax=Enterococcus larvae TaxID=2794352 RepID=A0ABS4CIN0_9ENTE|nr:leucine-rich repeat domain-containing protein [Enterococcus larvae]MBP1046488.1 hypothetical protein [Enterococcus larvae]
MKKSVKVSLSFLAVSTAIVASFVLGQRTTADEKKVYIPDESIRASVIGQAGWNPETGEEEVIENELPTVSQMERVESLQFGGVRSLEGIQYAKNVRYLSYSLPANDVVDFRPLAEMENLETLSIHASSEEGDKVLDISAFSELKNLKRLDLGYYVQVLDFSPLSELENLEKILVTGTGGVELPTMYVSRASRELIMSHPVTYSTQLDGEQSVQAYGLDSSGEYGDTVEVHLDGNRVTASNLDESIARIEFSFNVFSTDGMSGAQTNCSVPIIWY